MLPINIAVNLISGSNNSNKSSSLSSFRFNALHDHQTSSALKSIIIACSSSMSVASDVITNILEASSISSPLASSISNLCHLCFFLVTVAGNDDVFLSTDDLQQPAIPLPSSSPSPSMLSSTDRRKQASSLFLQSLFPTCASFIQNLATKKATERDEDRLQKLYQSLLFFDSFFDLWYTQVRNGHELIQKTFVKGFADVKAILLSKEFVANVIVTKFVSTLSATHENDTCSLAALMASLQLFRLLGTLNALVSRSTSHSQKQQRDDNHQFTAIIISGFASCLNQFKNAFVANMLPSVELNDDDEFLSTSQQQQQEQHGWMLLSSGVDVIVATLEPVNFTPVSIRVCESIIEASSNKKSRSPRTLLVDAVKRWREASSLVTVDSNNNNNNNDDDDLSLLHILACDCIKLGLSYGGDVGIRIFIDDEYNMISSSASSYSNNNAFTMETIDTLMRILMQNQNQNSRVGSLVLNLMLVIASPIINIVPRHSPSSSSSSNSVSLPCYFNLNHFEQLLTLCKSNDDDRIKRILLFILQDKPLLAIPSLLRTTIAKNSHFDERENKHNNNKNDNVITRFLKYCLKMNKILRQDTIERLCIDLVKHQKVANIVNFDLKQRFILLIEDEALKIELMASLIEDGHNDGNEDDAEFLSKRLERLLGERGDDHDESTNPSSSTSSLAVSIIMKMIQKLESGHQQNHNQQQEVKKLMMFTTPADIASAYSSLKNDNDDNIIAAAAAGDDKMNRDLETRKQNLHSALKQALLNILASRNGVKEEDDNDAVIVEFMKKGILTSPGSPMIVSILGSAEIKTSLKGRSNTILRFLQSDELFDYQQEYHQFDHQLQRDALHRAIAPLICLRVALSKITSAQILDIVLTRMSNRTNDDDPEANTRMNDDETKEEEGGDEIVINGNQQQKNFVFSSGWQFPEYRKMMAEILVSCCAPDVECDGDNDCTNFTRVVDYILNQEESSSSSSSSSLFLRFHMLLSCQLILSASPTTKKTTKSKILINNLHRLSRRLREVAVTALERSGSNDDRDESDVLFQACTDSISISFLGAVACRCHDSVKYDRAVMDWIERDQSVFVKDPSQEVEIIVPAAQEHTAKSIVLLVKRNLFTSLSVNTAQLWNAIGPSLVHSVLDGIAVSLHRLQPHHYHDVKSDDDRAKIDRVNGEMVQKGKTLSLQLISATSVLVSYCIEHDDDHACSYSQCLFDVMTVFANGAKAKYAPSMQNEVDDDIFSALLKMLVTVVGVVALVKGTGNHNTSREKSIVKHFDLKMEVFGRERQQIVEILKSRKKDHGERLLKERGDDVELIEFLLDMLVKEENEK